VDEIVKKSDEDIYDLDENSYVIDREPVLYTAKKDDQLFSSKILCPKMLLSKCFDSTNAINTNNSCLYNRILESDNLKLKQYNTEKKVTLADSDSTLVVPKNNGDPKVKAAASILVESNAASSISDVVHQKKEFLSYGGSDQKQVASASSSSSSSTGLPCASQTERSVKRAWSLSTDMVTSGQACI